MSHQYLYTSDFSTLIILKSSYRKVIKIKCKHCGGLVDPQENLRRKWNLGKGKRKTVIGNFLCPHCYQTFIKSLGSVIENEDKKGTEVQEEL